LIALQNLRGSQGNFDVIFQHQLLVGFSFVDIVVHFFVKSKKINMSGNNKDPADVVQQFIEKNKNALSEISFGGVMGYCSGMAFRRVGKAVGVVVGVGE